MKDGYKWANRWFYNLGIYCKVVDEHIQSVAKRRETHCRHQPGTGQEDKGLWTSVMTDRWHCCGVSWSETETVTVAEAHWGQEADGKSEEQIVFRICSYLYTIQHKIKIHRHLVKVLSHR